MKRAILALIGAVLLLGTTPLNHELWSQASAQASAQATPDVPSSPSIITNADEKPQIVLQPSYKEGEKIAIVFRGKTIEDAESSLLWTLPPTVQSEAGSSDGRRLLLWATPGSYSIELSEQLTLEVLVPDPADPSKFKTRKVTFPAYTYTATLIVESRVPVPPEPPKPDPNVPLVGLAQFVPDAAKRALVREFYEDFAAEAAKGTYVTTGHFRAAYRAALAEAQANGSLPKGIAPLDKPVSDRIALAIGLADGPVDAAKLAAVLTTVAQELNQ